jgi:NAD(P)-dependent dehydrogenase (short-subunit alcohol dehydrogenase family)
VTVTVVTGSSTGIGYATALRLAADGHHVIATMRNPGASDIELVAKERGLDLEVRPLDVNDDDSVAELFGAAGDVDVLVNNAGLGGSGGVVEETDLHVYRTIFETNVFGAIRCMKAVLPSMREKSRGCIVNVTSQAGRLAMPSMSAYCASKWALEAISESLAAEVAPFGIRVVAIEPGMILTPIWSKVDVTPPTGPYAPLQRRLGRVVLEEMKQGSPAEEVGDCIAEAIAAQPARLRWLTGRGAQRNVTNRAGSSDEEWIRIWNAPDEEFMARMFTEPD